MRAGRQQQERATADDEVCRSTPVGRPAPTPPKPCALSVRSRTGSWPLGCGWPGVPAEGRRDSGGVSDGEGRGESRSSRSVVHISSMGVPAAGICALSACIAGAQACIEAAGSAVQGAVPSTGVSCAASLGALPASRTRARRAAGGAAQVNRPSRRDCASHSAWGPRLSGDCPRPPDSLGSSHACAGPPCACWASPTPAASCSSRELGSRLSRRSLSSVCRPSRLSRGASSARGTGVGSAAVHTACRTGPGLVLPPGPVRQAVCGRSHAQAPARA